LVSTKVKSQANSASEIMPGAIHQIDFPPLSHAQKLKQPAISASAAAA
jgi:hypothetical protein